MICRDCQADVHPDHMFTQDSGLCRYCAFTALGVSADVAQTANRRADERRQQTRNAQARRAVDKPWGGT